MEIDLDTTTVPPTTTTPVPPVVPPQPPPASPGYVREIDLGDGSGIQRFIGNSPDELIDKLTEAQRNATMKIRELSQSIAPPPMPEAPPVPEPLTAEEQFVIGQAFATDPVGAFDALFERRTGMTYDAFQGMASYMSELQTGISVKSDIDHFLSLHEGKDYQPSESNRQLMLRALEAEELPVNRVTLEYAFNKLNTSGLLEKPPSNDRSMPSTISDRGNIAVPPKNDGSDVEQWLRTAPLEDVRKYYNSIGGQLGR